MIPSDYRRKLLESFATLGKIASMGSVRVPGSISLMANTRVPYVVNSYPRNLRTQQKWRHYSTGDGHGCRVRKHVYNDTPCKQVFIFEQLN